MLESVEIGTDQDGDTVSLTRVVHCHVPDSGARKRMLGAN